MVHICSLSTQEVGQENQEFKVILGYEVNLKLSWAT